MATALIVEDDVQLQNDLAAALKPRFDTLIAASGGEALEFAAIHHPVLIFLDVRLPDMDGIDLAQELRMTSGFESVPIVLFTGHVVSYVTEAARWMRHMTLLRKPCDRAAIDKAVEAALKNGSHNSAFRATQETRYGRLSGQVVEDVVLFREPLFGQQCAGDAIDPPVPAPAANEPVAQTSRFSLGSLIGDVCHDARSSLFVLSEFAIHAASGLDGDEHAERRQMLSVIQDRSTELRVLVDLLHNARKLQEECAPRPNETVLLGNLLEDVAVDCRRLVRRKTCACELHVDGDSRVSCDPDSLKVALLGLFSDVLSVAQSSSTLHLRMSTIETDVAIPVAEIEVHATLVGDVSPDVGKTGDWADLIGRDTAKCDLAAAIIHRHGGRLTFSWSNGLVSATVTLPLFTDQIVQPACERPCDVATDPRD